MNASNTRSYTAVFPEQKPLNVLDISASRRTIWTVGMGAFTIAIPSCILLAGLGVWKRRRNL